MVADRNYVMVDTFKSLGSVGYMEKFLLALMSSQWRNVVTTGPVAGYYDGPLSVA